MHFPEIVGLLIAFVVAGVLGWFLGRRRTLRQIKAALIRDRAIGQQQLLVERTNERLSEIQAVSNIQLNDQDEQELLDRVSDVIRSSERLINDVLTARYRLQQQSQELDRTRCEARTDPISGLANRRAFDEALEAHVAELRHAQIPFGLLLIDVDHFKQINDNHGHQVGDQILAQLGHVIRAQVRSRDFVARYGGDEFIILFNALPQHLALGVARRVQAAIQQSGFDCLKGAHELELNVTLSMGLATSEPDDTADSVLRRSDVALYRAKRNGRNQLVAWTAEIGDPRQTAN